jgi:hypothetical protein
MFVMGAMLVALLAAWLLLLLLLVGLLVVAVGELWAAEVPFPTE